MSRRRLGIWCLLWLWLAALATAFAEELREPAPYSLPNTEVFSVASSSTRQNYRIYVSLPRTYRGSEQRFPVVFLLDADYSFAIAHNVVGHLSDRADLPNLILVAIGYEGASQDRTVYRLNRMRDYSPTFNLKGGYGPSINRVSGGGPAFRNFLEEELLPLINGRYRTVPHRATLVGHSMGGMFATYVLFEDPQMFRNYIVVSPSLWWDNYLGLKMERDFAEAHEDLDARVFLSVGSLEERPLQPMVSTLKTLVGSLESRGYSSLSVSLHIAGKENHNTVFPLALTHGLLFAYGQP